MNGREQAGACNGPARIVYNRANPRIRIGEAQSRTKQAGPAGY